MPVLLAQIVRNVARIIRVSVSLVITVVRAVERVALASLRPVDDGLAGRRLPKAVREARIDVVLLDNCVSE